MNFYEYQHAAHKTAIYPQDKALEYLTLGLCGEAGEFANKVKKILRGDKTTMEDIQNLSGELGDVLWYLTELCTILGIPLEEVAKQNLEKLQSRKDRGVLGGSGDKR